MVTMIMAILRVLLIWRFVRVVLVVRGLQICVQISLPKHSFGSARDRYLVSQCEGLPVPLRISGLALSVIVPYGASTSVNPTVLMFKACSLARCELFPNHEPPSPVVFVNEYLE
jgi:hypothetical protein